MAIDIISRQGNDYVTIEGFCATSGTTSGQVTITVFASPTIPINSAVNVEAHVVAIQTDFSAIRTARVMGSFFRAAGDLTMPNNPIVETVGVLGVTVSLQANIVNQTIEVTVQGQAGKNINYRATVYLTSYR
jgi:hypothetical protein